MGEKKVSVLPMLCFWYLQTPQLVTGHSDLTSDYALRNERPDHLAQIKEEEKERDPPSVSQAPQLKQLAVSARAADLTARSFGPRTARLAKQFWFPLLLFQPTIIETPGKYIESSRFTDQY